MKKIGISYSGHFEEKHILFSRAIRKANYNEGTLKEISLLYSGGLDSTALAIYLLERYDKVHLITCLSGLSPFGHNWISPNLSRLKELYGDRLIFEKIIISEIKKKIMGPSLQLMRKSRSPLAICLICKLAMETGEILYCKKNHIHECTDGNSINQTEFFLQKRAYLKSSNSFFKRWGLKYRMNPLYYKSRDKQRKKLDSLGFERANSIIKGMQEIGINNMSDYNSKQPLCLGAVGGFIYSSPFRSFPIIRDFGLNTKEALKFRKIAEKRADIIIKTSLLSF